MYCPGEKIKEGRWHITPQGLICDFCINRVYHGPIIRVVNNIIGYCWCSEQPELFTFAKNGYRMRLRFYSPEKRHLPVYLASRTKPHFWLPTGEEFYVEIWDNTKRNDVYFYPSVPYQGGNYFHKYGIVHDRDISLFMPILGDQHLRLELSRYILDQHNLGTCEINMEDFMYNENLVACSFTPSDIEDPLMQFQFRIFNQRFLQLGLTTTLDIRILPVESMDMVEEIINEIQVRWKEERIAKNMRKLHACIDKLELLQQDKFPDQKRITEVEDRIIYLQQKIAKLN